jgi:hypothetical protein
MCTNTGSAAIPGRGHAVAQACGDLKSFLQVFRLEIEGNAAKEMINDEYTYAHKPYVIFCSDPCMVIHIFISSSIFCELEAQSRQSTKLYLQSSELGLPHPLTPSHPPGSEGKHTRLREMGWVGPNSNDGAGTVRSLIAMSRIDPFFLYVSFQSAILYV